MDAGSTAILVIVGILFGAGILVLLRAVACWYFKINRIVKLLEEISAKLGEKPATESLHMEGEDISSADARRVAGSEAAVPRPD